MMTAHPFYGSSRCRLKLVRAAFCRGHNIRCFYLYTRLQEQQKVHTNSDRNMTGIATYQHLPDPHREKPVQIPIARNASLTALPIPAVSSLTDCQTPAR